MRRKRWLVKGLGGAFGLLAFLGLLGFLAVQVQQHLLRRRAEQLSADMHGIRLYQSTWADAQRLMQRWGRWGHYEGSCTAQDCSYEVRMQTTAFYNPYGRRHAWLDWLLQHDRLNLYYRFGGRGERYFAAFTVHDGTVWRKGAAIKVEVPSGGLKRDDEFDKELTVGATARQRLHRTLKGWGDFIGEEEGLAEHPYYKVGRPGGCIPNCEMVLIYFSTHTPEPEIERLTDFQFSCFTRFHACTRVEDLLPLAGQWHLYDGLAGQVDGDAMACRVPLWARARDVRYVLSVLALSARDEVVQKTGIHRSSAQVKVLESLKEAVPWKVGTTVRAQDLYWSAKGQDGGADWVPGRRYLVFVEGNDDRSHMLDAKSAFSFERCGVAEDTAEARKQLAVGFAQNDSLAY